MSVRAFTYRRLDVVGRATLLTSRDGEEKREIGLDLSRKSCCYIQSERCIVYQLISGNKISTNTLARRVDSFMDTKRSLNFCTG